MIRVACLLMMMVLAGARSAYGRLGDTLDQAEARYGLEKKPKSFTPPPLLLDGAREVEFEFEGWRIRCALLLATDANYYVVREEYRKIWNGEVMKQGGVPRIRDFERDAIFKAEGGEWSFKVLAEKGNDLSTTVANQLVRSLGVTKAWVRADGALARLNIGEINMVLDLPQAFAYETQRKGVKEQGQRQQAQRLVTPDLVLPETGREPTPSPPPPVKNVAPAPAVVPHQTAPATPRPLPPSHSSPPSVPASASLPPTSAPSSPASSLQGWVVFIVLASLARVILGKRSKGARQRQARSVRQEPLPVPPIPSRDRARSVKDLTWDEFELLVGEIYRRQGFTVELAAGIGGDGGVDLTLHRGGERILVQCKSWNVQKVAVPAIREFFGVLVSENASRGFFVTTGEFTRDARDFAAGKPIDLIDGPAFQTLLRNASNDPHDDLLNVALWAPVFLGASRVTIPDCPFCKSKMVKRKGRAGAFLGCLTFPRCKGTREIRRHVRLD